MVMIILFSQSPMEQHSFYTILISQYYTYNELHLLCGLAHSKSWMSLPSNCQNYGHLSWLRRSISCSLKIFPIYTIYLIALSSIMPAFSHGQGPPFSSYVTRTNPLLHANKIRASCLCYWTSCLGCSCSEVLSAIWWYPSYQSSPHLPLPTRWGLAFVGPSLFVWCLTVKLHLFLTTTLWAEMLFHVLQKKEKNSERLSKTQRVTQLISDGSSFKSRSA